MIEGATRPGPTVTGFAINCAIAALRKHNIDPQQLLRRAGLSERSFDDPQARVTTLLQARFLEYSAEALGDTAFGLHLAEQGDPRDAGLIFYVGSVARNVGEALALVARYIRIADESVRMKLARQQEGFKVLQGRNQLRGAFAPSFEAPNGICPCHGCQGYQSGLRL